MPRHIFDCVIFAPWFKVCVRIDVSSSETSFIFFQIYHVIRIQYGVTKEWLCHFSVGRLGNFGVRHWTWVGCYKRHWLLLDAWCVRGLDFSLGTHLWKCFAGISWNELLGHGTALPKCAVPEHSERSCLMAKTCLLGSWVAPYIWESIWPLEDAQESELWLLWQLWMASFGLVTQDLLRRFTDWFKIWNSLLFQSLFPSNWLCVPQCPGLLIYLP